MKTARIAAPVLVLALLGLGWASSQSGQDLFQKALAKERAEGNLEEAIALYQQAVDTATDPALAAQAQLRIGMCYEKLGSRTSRLAQEAYQKVLDNYPSQSDETRIAREKLSLLSKAQAVMSGEDTSFRTRRIARLQPGVFMWGGTVSPDGRYFPYVNWKKGNIAVFDLKTGRYSDLTDDGYWGRDTTQFADFHRWSPDSRQLAYLWIKQPGERELRIVDMNSMKTRILSNDEGFVPEKWTADGRSILGYITTGDPEKDVDIEEQVAMLSVADGSVRILKNLGYRLTYDLWLDLSPDGRYAVYDLNSQEVRRVIADRRRYVADLKRDIHLFALDGSVDRTLVAHPANDRMPMWAPDGEHIIFLSDRTGAQGLYALKVTDGAAAGEPELIREVNGVHLGFADDRALYYSISVQMDDVVVADFEPKTGRITSTPEIVSRTFEGTSYTPSWSPDGRSVAYYAQRENSPVTLVVRDMQTGTERHLNLGRGTVVVQRPAKWGPDERWLSFIGNIDGQGRGVYRVDAESGKVSPVYIPGQDLVARHAWSPDAKVLFALKYVGLPGKGTAAIVARDMASGMETALYTGEPGNGLSVGPIAVSPDGGRLAYAVGNAVSVKDWIETIHVIPATGGRAVEILNETRDDSQAFAYRVNFSWSPDGQWLYYGRGDYPTSNVTLYRVSTSGGVPEELRVFKEEDGGMAGWSLHPGGQRVAFSFRKAYEEIWAMENFLPGKDAKK